MKQLPPFHEGQKVVSLIVHNQVCQIAEGEICTVHKVYQCSCGLWRMELVGKESSVKGKICCAKCEANLPAYNVLCKNFAPVIDDFQAISFTKVIDKELTSVN